MNQSKNRVVVITGAANGLGKALATEFYKQGCHLALIDIDSLGLRNLQASLSVEGQKLTIHEADISNEKEVISTRAEIIGQHRRIDVLVNNAGISNSQCFEQLDLADYKRLIDINFWGTVYCTKYFLKDLKQAPDGRLVNVISNFALMGFPGKTTYASSKSAVMGFSNALKTELAGTRLKVCLVIPPAMDTGIIANGKHIDPAKKQNEIEFIRRNAMPLDIVSRKIATGVEAGNYRIIIGTKTFWVDFLFRLFPAAMHGWIGRSKGSVDFV